MRKLSAKQKKVIDGEVGKGYYFFSHADKVLNLMEKLEKINDYETLWSDAERYFHDKEVQRQYERRG